MKTFIHTLQIFGFLILLNFGGMRSQAIAMESTGIGQLIQVPKTSLEQLITSPTRPLITASAVTRFLTELEKTPPNWESLHDHPEDEQGTQIFQFNRTRDNLRNGHQLLQQRIAFLWDGLLRKYDNHYRGFRIAVGPVFTHTAWGVVRFKPVNIPAETIAIPSRELLKELQARVAHGEEIEVCILYTGSLIPQESVMYAFSHDNPDLGMILPFVHIDGVHYILKDSP